MRKLTAVFILGALAGWCSAVYHTTPLSLNCGAPSGAMSAIEYQEIFIGKLHDLKFSCIPTVSGLCSAYLCTEFDAVDEQNKHVIGYVWRDVWNKPEAVASSPDGGRAGSFYGECPVGTPVATVYKCPWCEPDLTAKADTRGQQ